MKQTFSLLLILFFLCSCKGLPPQIDPLQPNNLQIHDLQGCSQQSPFLNQNISQISGVVTWKDNHGFFMQGTVADNQDCSSEGIYVFTSNYPNVIPGDSVLVTGKLVEYTAQNEGENQLSSTEIDSTSIKIISSNNPLPKPVLIGSHGRIPPNQTIEDDHFAQFDPENDGIDFYESMEGMRVEIDNAVVVGPENSYSEVFIIPAEMISQNIVSSHSALLASEIDQNPEKLRIQLPSGYKRRMNSGDQFTSPIIGILTYAYGNYEIVETNLPVIQPANNSVIEKLPTLTSNELRIATYNTENLTRFDQKRVKNISNQIVRNLNSPDLLILEEIQDDSGSEEDGTVSAQKTLQLIIQDILNNGGPEYSYLDQPPQNNSSGGQKGGNIRTVILYRTDRGLKFIGAPLENESNNFSVFSDSRIPIIKEFSFHNQNIILFGVHLTSNGANSPLFGSAQPILKPEESKRIKQAQWVLTKAKQLEKIIPGAIILIAGDFNDTPYSPTLQTIQSGGFLDLADNVDPTERYSILYEGNAYLYDQILMENNSSVEIHAAAAVHLNTFRNSDSQISDHDPFSADLLFK